MGRSDGRLFAIIPRPASPRRPAGSTTSGQQGLRSLLVSTVHFTSTAQSRDHLDREAVTLVRGCREAVGNGSSRFQEARDPEAADFIVFIEPPRHKFEGYGRVLAQNPLVQRFAEGWFAYDWADGPAGFLPGVYPSLARTQWDPARLVAGGFLLPYTEAVLHAAADRPKRDVSAPQLLLSFRGAASHPVRTNLLHTRSMVDDPWVDFSLSDEWFTHTSGQKTDHVSRVLSAKFALCPRGVGPATFRIYESMALGRAPVIVSEIGPAGPDWGKFVLVVSEARIADPPRIVREREEHWAEMGRAARQAWEDFFAHPAGITQMLEAMERISLARPRGETLDELKARWSSRRFKRDNDWAKTQRLLRLLSSPAVRARLRRKLVQRA